MWPLICSNRPTADEKWRGVLSPSRREHLSDIWQHAYALPRESMSPAENMIARKHIGLWWRWWTFGYVVLLCTVVGTMFWMRQSAVADLSSPKSIADWQAWREDVREQQ